MPAPASSIAVLESPILVLGATSLIGRFLTPMLAGADACALSRRPGEGGVRWLRDDLGSPDLAGRLPPARTVISLSPIWLLPQALGALRQAGMRRLVAFSSTSVSSKADSPDAHERSVAARLAAGEARVRAFCAAEGVAWTLLRPTLIYAEGQDQNVSRLASLIRRFGVLPLAGEGSGLRQPVHAEDLALAALAAAASPAAAGRAYDLPGGETLTYRRMAERVFEGMGRRPRIIAAPQWLWRLGFVLARPLLPGATAQMGGRMSADLSFNGAPAKHDFGWSPRTFRPDFRNAR